MLLWWWSSSALLITRNLAVTDAAFLSDNRGLLFICQSDTNDQQEYCRNIIVTMVNVVIWLVLLIVFEI